MITLKANRKAFKTKLFQSSLARRLRNLAQRDLGKFNKVTQESNY